MAPTEINTVIIGGGHCGVNLALTIEAAPAGQRRSYVVLEKGRAFEHWRSKRWDAFQLNTTQKYCHLLGEAVDPVEGEKLGGHPLSEDIARWEAHAKASGVVVREHSTVASVERTPEGLFLTTVESADGGPVQYLSKNVVACNGRFDKAKVPFAPQAALSKNAAVAQFTPETFRNEGQLNAGGVLVVGAGQTGVQLADHLRVDCGRTVALCTSFVPATARYHRGEEIFNWLERVGILTMPKEALAGLPKEKAMGIRYGPVPQVGAVKPISYPILHRAGIELLGGLDSVSSNGTVVTLKPNRLKNVGFAKAAYEEAIGMYEAWVAKQPEEVQKSLGPLTREEGQEPVPVLLKEEGPATFDLTAKGITNVIWCTGWAPSFAWLKIPEVLDGAFDPVDGQPAGLGAPGVDGFFFSGFSWQTHCQSENLNGFLRDHPKIVEQLRA